MRCAQIVTAVIATFLTTMVPSQARADDDGQPSSQQPPPPPAPRPPPVRFEPFGGIARARWLTIPVTRGFVGLDIVAREESGINPRFTVQFSRGATENGLTASRFELGGGISKAFSFVTVAGGVHVAVASVSRITYRDTIVGVGIGAHASVSAGIRLGDEVLLSLGVRGAADLYDGAKGYEAGPFGSIRF